MRSILGGGLTDVAFAPDGSMFAGAAPDGTVALWDAGSLSPVGALGGATQLWRRWRRRVYTAGIQVHATLSGGTSTRACDPPVPLSLALHCRVASTATNFRKPPVIVDTEATHA